MFFACADAAAFNEKALLEHEAVIQELRESVVQSAQHVRHLQQQLMKTTDAVVDAEGEQSQVCSIYVKSITEFQCCFGNLFDVKIYFVILKHCEFLYSATSKLRSLKLFSIFNMYHWFNSLNLNRF